MTQRVSVQRTQRIEVVREDLTSNIRGVPTIQAIVVETGPRGTPGPPGPASTIPGPQGPGGVVLSSTPPDHSVLWADTTII